MRKTIGADPRGAASHDEVLLAIGRQSASLQRAFPPATASEAGFRVFSQWDEDGIIQYLVDRVPVERTTFVEIGVEDYRECNTRFLLCNDGWEGLAIDSGTAHRDFIERTELRWRYPIDTASAWITADNVNHVIADAGFVGDVGLVSLDVDGNDYWVLGRFRWSPRILIVEYNSAFGPDRAVNIPYREDFSRTKAHYSNLYYGASLAALRRSAVRKGYRLVTSNRAGNNAFFVRDDVAGDLPDRPADDAWVRSAFREARDTNGRLTYLDPHRDGLELIGSLPLVDVESGTTRTVADLLLGT